jgi:prepilin-type N-terminal cleavage/methylation domain-containing protein
VHLAEILAIKMIDIGNLCRVKRKQQEKHICYSGTTGGGSMHRRNSAGGFTLVELLVVMVIVCILATGVVFLFADPTAKVKGAAFSLLTDLNHARSEAVSRNEDVLVDFIQEVLFRPEVRFYDCSAAPPYPEGGPARTPSGTRLAGKNGIIFGGPDHLKWQPDGTSGDNGSIILYHPASRNPQRVRGSPYAAVISSAATGRIRLMRWRREIGWSRK